MSPYDQFKIEMQRIENLQGMYISLQGTVTSAIDFSDLLRSIIVLSISALDFYVHAVVRRNMAAILAGTKQETPHFRNFNVKISSVRRALANPVNFDWLNDEVSTQHSWKSFQQPDKIKEALQLITEKKVWEEVGSALGLQAVDVKRELELLVDRRNKIAHEADADPSLPTQKLPINTTITANATKFISDLVREIDALL